MITEIFNIKQCQKIEIPQGALYLGPSDKEQSLGYLELSPKQSLTLHNRSAVERLTQIQGKCSMVVYDGGEGRIVPLKEKDVLTISPSGTWHIHVNPYEKVSLTYWDFEGDITAIIESIRKGAT